MVDVVEIRKRYGAMSDAELIHFAKQDGGDLTELAVNVLKAEFARRHLDPDLINRIEDGSYTEEQARLKRIARTIPYQEDATALTTALNEKRDGKNDEAIMYHLMEIGMDEEKAMIVTEQIKPEAEARQKKARNAMLTSMFAVCAGFALYLISPYKPVVTFLDILSTCTIAFGVLRFLTGFIDFKKFETILRQIDAESTTEKKQPETGDVI